MEEKPFTEERNAIFAKLQERARQPMTLEERADFERTLRYWRDYYSVLDCAYERGVAQGVDKFLRTVVSNMNAKGIKVSIISHCTGLTEEEVLRIIQPLS